MTRIALALTACLLALCSAVSAQTSDPSLIPPGPPSELVAVAYSPTAGEVRWERGTSNRLVTGYELTRDGEVLGVFDALSYVERSLDPGTRYGYRVVAIDIEGLRSDPAFVTLVTPEFGAANPPPSTGTTLIPPGPPTALVAVAYSPTAGEVRWERGTSNRLVTGYELTRDGEVLGVFDALSYVERSLDPGTRYDYRVVAIDIEGLRSDPAFVTLVTPGTAVAASLASPAELRAEVYSRRSAELFWRREPAALALRYEIRRDGEIVGTTNGISYYTSRLEGGRDYAFEVVAIDPEGRRSSPSRITFRTTGDGPPVAGGPGAPAELRAEVYSRRSAELFWRREPAALALRYEIRRDGQIVGDTNGVSYYTSGLAAGTEYAFEVVAIDRDGRRSSPSRITLRTDGGTTPPADSLAAPANLRAEVYSRTAAELFWDRAVTPGLRYEVRRDGAVIGATNGTSFYDDTLKRGTSYAYEVVALDGERRSDASTVTLSTGGDSTAPPSPVPELPDDTAIVLETVFTVANGDAFEPLLAFLERIDPRNRRDAERTPISSAPDPDFPRAGPREVFACPDGGTFAVAAGSVSGSGNFYSTIAEGCVVGDVTVDGTFLQASEIGRGTGPSSFSTSVLDYRLVDVVGGTTTTIGSGEVVEFEPEDRDGGAYVIERWSATDLSVDDGGTTDYSVAGLLVSFPGGSLLDPNETNGLAVTIDGLSAPGLVAADVETTLAFRRAAGDERFGIGVLTLNAEGLVATLDTDSGDADTFLLTIETNGTVTSFPVPWSDRFDFARVDPENAPL